MTKEEFKNEVKVMDHIKIPTLNIVTINSPINLEDLNSSTISHVECSVRKINYCIEEETKITYYNTNPKSAIRYITRFEVDMMDQLKIISELKTLHIFNKDGSEDMIKI